MCTHVALRLRQSPRQILHAINCHYDHKGLLARAESSKIVLRKAREAVQWSRQMQGAEGEEPLVRFARRLMRTARAHVSCAGRRLGRLQLATN
jgi:hypothetical protein